MINHLKIKINNSNLNFIYDMIINILCKRNIKQEWPTECNINSHELEAFVEPI